MFKKKKTLYFLAGGTFAVVFAHQHLHARPMNSLSPSSTTSTVAFPTLSSFLRLLPLALFLFLTNPHDIAEQVHSIYSSRSYLKPSARDPFPSKYHDINLRVIRVPLAIPLNRTGIFLQPGTSLHAVVRAPSVCTNRTPCSALLEAWYDSGLSRELKPDPYFLAANHEIPQPLPPNPPNQIADDEAFLVWRPYHYIQIPSIYSNDQWHVRVYNHDSTVFNILNASLRVTIVQTSQYHLSNFLSPGRSNSKANDSVISGADDKLSHVTHATTPTLCPSGPSGHACSTHGQCSSTGACVCDDAWGGHYCETQVLNLPTGAFDVSPGVMRVFRYVAPRRASITTTLEFLPSERVSIVARPLLFAKRPGANGGNKLLKGPPLPTIYDLAFTDTAAIQRYQSIQNVVTPDVREGESILIGVYNFRPVAPAWLMRRHRILPHTHSLPLRQTVRVRVWNYPCIDRNDPLLSSRPIYNFRSKGLPLCAPSSDQYWNIEVGDVLFPMVFGLVLLMTLVRVSICTGVFRQPMLDSLMGTTDTIGRAQPYRQPHRDKLSEAEVNAMFPSFKFTKGESEALGAVGDASCSVCLCSFEEPEMLRRLTCGHSYHSSCLDRWLLTNASCPRCRKPARINGNAFQSGIMLWQIVRVLFNRILSLVTWIGATCRISFCGGENDDVTAESAESPRLRNEQGQNAVAVRVMRVDLNLERT